MKKLILLTFFLLFGISAVNATDIPITPTGPVFQLQPALTWGTSGPGGFNNNFFFTPLAVNESVCVYVKNNNTTNLHTFTGAIAVTSDPSNSSPSGGTWQNAATANNLNAPASPGVPAGIGAQVSGAAQVSVNFSASSVLGGSPETASVTIIQTSGSCFAGNGMTSSSISTIASSSPLQAISESLSTSFATSSSPVNPNGAVIHINANNGARSVYLDHAIVSCSAACTIQLNTRANATGCVAVSPSPVNLKVAFVGALTPTAFVGGSGCVTSGGAPFSLFDLAANTPTFIDLRGLLLVANTTQGLEVTCTLTGTVRATLFWYEK